MKITLLATILTLVGTIRCGRITPKLFSDEHIQFINSQAKTWIAGRNFPEDTTIEDFKKLLGTRESKIEHLLKYKVREETNTDSIPETFDARQQWPNCSSVSLIRDQSSCGSCWAVATTSVASDRICIQSKGQKQTQLSTLDLMTCCDDCGDGCNGGFADSAFRYWEYSGLVSGGEYSSDNGCRPYPFPQCSRSTSPEKYPKCPDDIYQTPACTKKCTKDVIKYDQDLNTAEKVYRVPKNVQQIQLEIMTNGPVLANYDVYDDFGHYKSGVYQVTKGAQKLDGHSVRILGWGVENNIPYWLVANSWNTLWGDNGTFKIIRGKNEANFETHVMAGTPDK